MKTLRASLILVTLAGLILAGCSEKQEITQSERVVSVKALVLEPTNREIVSTFTGSLEGQRQAILHAKIAEPVDSVLVREGERVKRNDVLVMLDRTGPSADYRQAQSTFQNAEKNYRKMKNLYESGAVSESEYDAAKTNYEVAKAAFESVKRLVDIESPIDGIVTSVDVTTGDYVTMGQKLATVARIDTLRVRFNVNPEEIPFFRKGATVRIESDAVDTVARGVVETVASSADPTTRSFQVEALVGNRAGRFRPGMFVRIKYIRQELHDVIAIPGRSIISLNDTSTVFIVQDGAAYRHTIKLGPDLSGEVVIDSGLSVGDTLVTLGQDYLDDSTRVNITTLNEQAQ